METKTCKRCGHKKALEHFNSDPKMSGGRVSTCRECVKLRQRELREQYPERYLGYARSYRQRNPETAAEARRVCHQKNGNYISSDRYIRDVLVRGTSLEMGQVPPELVQAKLEQLELLRLSRQVKRELKEKR